MATEPADVSVSSFFEQTDFDAHTFESFASLTHSSYQTRERFEVLLREAAERPEGQAGALRLGVGYLILGKYGPALEHLAKAGGGRARHYFAAQALLGLSKYREAIDSLHAAIDAGWDRTEAELEIAAIHVRAASALAPRVRSGDSEAERTQRKHVEEAEKLIARHGGPAPQPAQWHYVCGTLAELRDERDKALDAYEACLLADPDHTAANFRAARLYEFYGRDEQALERYNQLSAQPRAFANALLNAALLYEDQGEYGLAAECLRRVLHVDPNHRRARLFLKSVESTRESVRAEQSEIPLDPRARLLARPVADFELSVRARNCLKKMNVRTLGDLIKLREDELLAYKNFGETSLSEIKAILAKHGLRLGQPPEEAALEAVVAPAPGGAAAPRPVAPSVPQELQGVLAKAVSELELSVRSRRCLQRLNVKTLHDLIQYSEADLLATRNFGVTSLNEIKARLAEHGLSLATRG